MRRELQELALLLGIGTAVGIIHLALRPEMTWLAAPRQEGVCDGGGASLAEPEVLMSTAEDAP